MQRAGTKTKYTRTAKKKPCHDNGLINSKKKVEDFPIKIKTNNNQIEANNNQIKSI